MVAQSPVENVAYQWDAQKLCFPSTTTVSTTTTTITTISSMAPPAARQSEIGVMETGNLTDDSPPEGSGFSVNNIDRDFFHPLRRLVRVRSHLFHHFQIFLIPKTEILLLNLFFVKLKSDEINVILLLMVI